jgi:hypothetical protein
VHVHVTARRAALLAGAAVVTVALASCTAPQAEPTETASDVVSADANMVQCMADKGWEVQLDNDGGWSTTVGVPDEQLEQFDADVDDCRATFGLDQPPPPLTQQEAEELYDLLTGAVADCVRNLGYTVPEPPSRQAYVELLTGGGLADWHPHYVPEAEASFAVYQEVRAECPVP